MISDSAVTLFLIAIVMLAAFIVWSIRTGRTRLIHRLYLTVCVLCMIWMLALIALKFTPADNAFMIYFWDATVYIGCGTAPVLPLLVSLTFVKGLEKFPKKYWLFFIIPVITNIVVWTNPLHHLFYRKFSLLISEIEFGPYIFVTGAYCYICLTLAIVIMMRFALHSRSKLVMRQALLYSLGSLAPLLASAATTLRIVDLPITATPVSFLFTMIVHGLAIYRLHLLDIRPIAMQRVLDWISDGYLVLSDKLLVLNYNQPFKEVFGSRYGVEENVYLQACLRKEDIDNKTPVYNLVTTIEASERAGAAVSYEQALTLVREGKTDRRYFVVDVSPLMIDNQLAGWVVIFKDVTKVKESMQRLQSNQARMMEQERLASLGQMVGGIAHNLKTPIMSVSGGVAAMENLLSECRASLGDSDVSDEDYLEIYGEMEGWMARMRDACAYMSEIISAVKGQATNMNASDVGEFALEELLRRVRLLMRHELVSGACELTVRSSLREDVILHGNINNLVQVLNNLISNAVDAMRPAGGKIEVLVEKDGQSLILAVADNGPGVPEKVRDRLFKEMVTSKGAMGTGLGLYISNVVIHGKFGGKMSYRPGADGGSIFQIEIPLESVSFQSRKDDRR